MWYVIQVMVGHENRICDILGDYLPADCGKSFVPMIRRDQRIKGKLVTTEKIMFPGYIFVETQDSEELFLQLKNVPEMTKLIRFGEDFIPISRSEEENIKRLGGRRHVIETSKGFITGSEVKILSGPLMDYPGEIIHIDRHKRKAVIKVDFMGQSVRMTVGLEIVEKLP